jgi:hypothetical protein
VPHRFLHQGGRTAFGQPGRDPAMPEVMQMVAGGNQTEFARIVFPAQVAYKKGLVS